MSSWVIHFDIPGCLIRIEELEDKMNAPEFWNDLEKSQKINQELKSLKSKVNKYNGFKTRLEDTEVLIQLGLEMQICLSRTRCSAESTSWKRTWRQCSLKPC